jgi:LacI family transcriptional regulator
MGSKGDFYNIMKVTMKDIAKETGFTINTVSRALKDKDDISEATRKLIKETAKNMGYISNTIAGALRSGVTKSIAVILGDISNPHFSIMVKEIEKAARNHNYSTFIINTDENCDLEAEAINSALGKQVDGIIICPTQKSTENIEFLQKTRVPFVLIGRYFKELQTDYVICNDVNGGYLATKHLIEKGHQNIMFLNGPSYISSAFERHEGYKKALSESGIQYDSALVHEMSITSGESKRMVRKILEGGVKFTAVFAFSDMIAWETIYILNKAGFKVPQDIAVIGFDNIQSKLSFPMPLTSISTSKSKMSRRAVDILLKRINKNKETDVINDVIDTKVVVREST